MIATTGQVSVKKHEKFEGVLLDDPCESVSGGAISLRIKPDPVKVSVEKNGYTFFFEKPGPGPELITLGGGLKDIAMEYMKAGQRVSGEGEIGFATYDGKPTIFATSIKFGDVGKDLKTVEKVVESMRQGKEADLEIDM